jgi:hypothetical protein
MADSEGVGPRLIVGLTGGIASGKSLVGAMFVKLGASLIDTDVVAREVVAPGQPGLAAIAAEFGPTVLLPTGELDRRALRSQVFADEAKRQTLEAILHPLIRARTRAKLAELTAPYALVADSRRRLSGAATARAPHEARRNSETGSAGDAARANGSRDASEGRARRHRQQRHT